MKKVFLTLIIFAMITGCGLYQVVDINKLMIGMTKAQVYDVIGAPQRVLAANQTRDGFLEVLEYKTYRNEVYALEFWNDYLTGYEFLYEDVTYVPASAPPTIVPVYGTPLPPAKYRPSKPVKPAKPTKPATPATPARPVNPNLPGTTRSGTATDGRSSTNTNTRPNNNNTQPNTRSSDNNTQQNTRQNDTNSNTNTRSSQNDGSSGTRSTENGRTNDNSGNQNTENGRSSGTGGRSN